MRLLLLLLSSLYPARGIDTSCAVNDLLHTLLCQLLPQALMRHHIDASFAGVQQDHSITT
jgi:hypothetical protein